jgi:hypothetical protein
MDAKPLENLLRASAHRLEDFVQPSKFYEAGWPAVYRHFLRKKSISEPLHMIWGGWVSSYGVYPRPTRGRVAGEAIHQNVLGALAGH